MFRLLLGTVMISFSAVFVKLVTVEPTASAFYRMLFGGLLLAAWAIWRRERWYTGGVVLAGLAGAALLFALDLAFWHRSILYVGPGIATLLANFQVIILALAGVLLFGESAGWRFTLSIACALAGLVLLVGGDWAALSDGYKLGIGLGLLTAVCYAGYILALRGTRATTAGLSSAGSIALLSLLCAGMLGVFVLAQGESLRIASLADAGWLAAYGITAQILGWSLIAHALPAVPASRVGLILLLQPICAFVWDALFFARHFTATEIIGAAIALVAIYLGTARKRVTTAGTEKSLRV